MVHVPVVATLLPGKQSYYACNRLLLPSWCRGHRGGTLGDGHLEGVDRHLGNQRPAGETREAGSGFSVFVLEESYIVVMIGCFHFLLKEERKSFPFP